MGKVEKPYKSSLKDLSNIGINIHFIKYFFNEERLKNCSKNNIGISYNTSIRDIFMPLDESASFIRGILI